MSPGITAKLFAGVLATALSVALIMAVAGRWGFHRDFRRYAEELESRQVESLADALAEQYGESGDWDFLRGERGRWRHFLFRFARREGAGSGPPGGRHPGGALRLAVRLAVLDGEQRFVAGNPRAVENATLVPVHWDGRTVGWVARAPFERPTAVEDLRLQRAQLRTLGVAVVAAVLFAALAAWLLARLFLAPARELGRATHRLAAGDYSARVPPGSRDEFGQLARDFNLLARALERNEQSRREFMAGVAHELRTPLAVLKAELEALAEGVRPISADALTSLQGEVNALAGLVGDVYDLSLADVGALAYRKEHVDLRALLGQAAGALGERAAAVGLAVEYEGLEGPPLAVHGDPVRLRQLFANLLENALAYTASPGRIRIECASRDGQARIAVEDSPPGVPAEALPRLFERFYRVEGSRSREHGGAGLGLALCRSIVEAHGGRIEAAGSSLGGLAVTVWLPLEGGTA